MARPTKYTREWAEEKAPKIPEIFDGGKDVIQVCHELDISKRKYYELVNKYDFFKEAHEKGRQSSEAYWLNVVHFAASGGKNKKTGERYKGNAYLLNKLMNNKFGWYESATKEVVVETKTEQKVDRDYLEKIRKEVND